MNIERARRPGLCPAATEGAVRRGGSRAGTTCWMVAMIGIAAGLPVLVSGCAGLRIHSTDRPRAVAQPLEQPPVAKSTAGGEQEALAAIEDFLARTQQYRLPDSPASPTEQGAVVGKETSSAPPAISAAGVRPALPRDKALANTQVTIPDDAESQVELAIPALQSVAIRWDDPEQAGAPNPVETNTTNAPLAASADEAPASLDRVVQHLQSRVEEHGDFDAEWRLRMAQLALDRDEEATMVSATLPEGTRGLLGALLKAAVAVRNMTRNPMLNGEEALARLDTLHQFVAERADPLISAVALCRKVVTFGVYDEMAAEDFVAGRTIQTIVYSEIRNLRSLQTDDGLQETRLAGRLEVLTADGESVWQRDDPEITDLCRQRRNDFFIAQRVTLPPTLSAGDYVLKVLVEDKLSGRADEASRPFTINSPLSVAKNK